MKVTLTYSEAVEMLKKAYYPLTANVELQIEHEVTAVVPEDNPWIDVSKNWRSNQCPDGYDIGTIEICTRDGHGAIGSSTSWTSMWKQENHSLDIIKYRKVL